MGGVCITKNVVSKLSEEGEGRMANFFILEKVQGFSQVQRLMNVSVLSDNYLCLYMFYLSLFSAVFQFLHEVLIRI
jgi:hypothetical protein